MRMLGFRCGKNTKGIMKGRGMHKVDW